MDQFLVQLIGPGGSGKSTVGRVLAERLNVLFLDLDNAFVERLGDISEYIDGHGYRAYALENVETYRQLLLARKASCVIAVSSGFMTYSGVVHPAYIRLRREIESCSTTFVLLPSLKREECVAEIVRRQLTRPFARSPEAEEAVIRERFDFYLELNASKVETMRTPVDVAREILLNLPPNIGLEPSRQFRDAKLSPQMEDKRRSPC